MRGFALWTPTTPSHCLSIKRIVIGAEIVRQTGTSNRLLEHPAERQAIDDSALDPESDDSACVLVHDDQHPIGLQGDRFTSKQVEAPQTVLQMTDERQPGGTAFPSTSAGNTEPEFAEPHPY